MFLEIKYGGKVFLGLLGMRICFLNIEIIVFYEILKFEVCVRSMMEGLFSFIVIV